jgi:hypothetical protein
MLKNEQAKKERRRRNKYERDSDRGKRHFKNRTKTKGE